MEQQTGNFNAKEHRQGLFSTLEHVINVSKTKFDKEKASNSDRQKWARVIITGVQAYGSLLHDIENEELEERIRKLEEVKR